MARSQMTTSDSLRKEAWEEELFRDTVVNSYFLSKFAGNATSSFVEKGAKFESAPENIIQVKTNLEMKGKTKTRDGDKITFGLVPRIDPTTNAGVTSGQTLKGREVALSWYNYSLELERYRQAVSAGGHMDWQRASFDMPVESRSALLTWGSEKMDLLCFQALEASPSNILYKTSDTGPVLAKTGTLATAKTALTAADSKITPAFLDYVATWARTGGGRASAVPIRPIMVDGKPYYVYLTHPDAAFDWGNNSTAMQAMREAEVRGKENPIFSGASYVWKGVIIHTHEFVTVGEDAGAGSDVAYTYGHLLGAQALCWAWGERPSVVEDTEDYEEDLFYAWRMTGKVGSPKFNSQTYGSLATLISRTNISGL